MKTSIIAALVAALATAAIFLALWPGKPKDDIATQAAWYLRGEFDTLVHGMYVANPLTCRAVAKNKVACFVRVTGYQPYPVCSTGTFTLKGLQVIGQFSQPKRCAAKP